MMRFPPIKAGRVLLWITLRPDDTVRTRYAALRAVLKACHLHPVDTTSAAELVIVEEAAFRVHLGEVQGVLGTGDRLHLISTTGERLVVEVIAAAGVLLDPVQDQSQAYRPVWLQD